VTHKLKKRFIIFTSILVLGTAVGVAVENSTEAETISRGWQLTLNQNLTIAAQSAGVYLQYGKVVTDSETDLYYPNCRLEVRDPLDKPQIVTADTFTIYRVKWTEEDVLLHSNQYASNAMIRVSSPTADDYKTTLYLRSEKQPEVTRLICKHWEDPTGFAEHLTLQQIRSTLGEIFALQAGNK